MAVALVAVATLGIFGLIAVSRRAGDDAGALLASRVLAARELDGLQARCARRLHEVLASAYDPGRPVDCGNLPLGLWQEAQDLGVPGLAYRLDVTPVDAVYGADGRPREMSVDLVAVEVTVRWDRAFPAGRQGQQAYRTFLFGDSEEYWEDWDEWRARAGVGP